MNEELTLREKFRKASGLVLDIDKMIAEAETEEQKYEIFNHVAWHMPRGTKHYKGTENGDMITTVLTEVADNLGIDPAIALEFDGTLSERDEALLSSIEVVTDDNTESPTETPTELPSEEPTNEPTEEPSEEPTEIPTETPTELPSEEPTNEPTEEPTEAPEEIDE